MRWENLKDYNCPTCRSPLQGDKELHFCKECNFSIREKVLSRITKGSDSYREPNRSDWEW